MIHANPRDSMSGTPTPCPLQRKFGPNFENFKRCRHLKSLRLGAVDHKLCRMHLDTLYSELTLKTAAKLALVVMDGLGDLATQEQHYLTPLEAADRKSVV